MSTGLVWVHLAYVHLCFVLLVGFVWVGMVGDLLGYTLLCSACLG